MLVEFKLLLDKILDCLPERWIYKLLEFLSDENNAKGEELRSELETHFIFNIKAGDVYEVVCCSNPEIPGTVHETSICGSHGGACKVGEGLRVT
jgi:hypothetical protein